MKNKKSNLIIIIAVASGLVFLYCVGCIIVANVENIPQAFIYIFAFGDIANTAVGALLGFGTSLILENHILKRSRAMAIENIVGELYDMSNYVLSVLACETKSDNEHYDRDELTMQFGLIRGARFCVMLPIWESIVQNGDLLQFKKKSYFNQLIKTYTYLITLKEEINAFADAPGSSSCEMSMSVILAKRDDFRAALNKLKQNGELKPIFDDYAKSEKVN